MDTDNMDKSQAQQLAKHIQHEAPHLIIKVGPVEAIGWKAWAVYAYERESDDPLLQIENLSEWEAQKKHFLPS